ncbi:hypothetical protein [Streptomyces sp. NRRL F-5630]|uniref:hypothetical protein n=1 Tax=Streptomyces sp. NRRL F-5630 TaxID=1463864 RepID=UPI003EC0C49C
MTQNAETPRAESGAFQEDLAAGVGPGTKVPDGEPTAQQRGLFPGKAGRPVARPLVLITRGRVEYLARCPGCKDMHRHTHLGKVTGPCGKRYALEPRRGRRAAA